MCSYADHYHRAILHDENVYPDPYSFRPERFMKDGKIDLNVQDPGVAAFGYGRRIWCALHIPCWKAALMRKFSPGRHMAMDTMWLSLAYILTAFDIRKALDTDGQPITPSGRYITNMTRCVSC